MYDLELWKNQKKILQLTFNDLAKATNLSISTIKAIFNGTTTDPRIETVSAIEDALELKNGITQEERNAGWTSYKSVSITPDEDDLLYYFRELGKLYGKEMQQAQLTVIKNLVEVKK